MTPERLEYLRHEFIWWLPPLAFAFVTIGLVVASGHPLLSLDPLWLLYLASTILWAIWIGRNGYRWLRARGAP